MGVVESLLFTYSKAFWQDLVQSYFPPFLSNKYKGRGISAYIHMNLRW